MVTRHQLQPRASRSEPAVYQKPLGQGEKSNSLIPVPAGGRVWTSGETHLSAKSGDKGRRRACVRSTASHGTYASPWERGCRRAPLRKLTPRPGGSQQAALPAARPAGRCLQGADKQGHRLELAGDVPRRVPECTFRQVLFMEGHVRTQAGSRHVSTAVGNA